MNQNMVTMRKNNQIFQYSKLKPSSAVISSKPTDWIKGTNIYELHVRNFVSVKSLL